MHISKPFTLRKLNSEHVLTVAIPFLEKTEKLHLLRGTLDIKLCICATKVVNHGQFSLHGHEIFLYLE